MRTFLHSGDLGDIIYALPAIKKAGGGILYLVNREDITKKMTPERFAAIRALLLAQPYIEDVRWHEGQPVDFDFTEFRKVYQPSVTLVETQWRYVHKFGAPETEAAWLTAGKHEKHGRPVIARSPRWNNPEWEQIWPEILREYPDPLFIGSKEEHAAFCERFDNVEHRLTEDLLDVAKVIAGASNFIGNQSSPYAIAEGLKVPAILEAFKNTKRPGYAEDCRFPDRPGLLYISRLRDWHKAHKPATLMIALQIWPGDLLQGRALLELICDIEPRFREDIEVAIIGRRDVPRFALEDFASIARRKFAMVHIVEGKRTGTGWPDGCNDLWQDGMRQLSVLADRGLTKADGVLTFEPDCLPLRPDWLSALKAEWRKVKSTGKLVLGHAHNEPATHINGNAIFAIKIIDTFPQLQLSRTGAGWDVEHGKLLLANGADSAEIFQLYRIKEINRETLEGIQKRGKVPAFFHGIKTMDGIRIIREKMADGTFYLAKDAATELSMAS